MIRTSRARQRLLELLADDHVRQQVADVNLNSQSVVVLTTVGALTLRGEEVQVQDRGQTSTEPRQQLRLRVGVDDVRQKTGTVVVLDRFRRHR